MLAGDSAEPIAGDERALTQDMRIHSSQASPALPTSPQALAKSSGESFLSILSSASEGPNSGATGTDTDPHADRRGAEADSNEQNDTASASRALEGGTRSNGPGQHMVQKNDSAVASAKGQGALAANNGSRAVVPGAYRSASADETKDASASAVRAVDSSAMAQASVEAQASMSSFQGALASLSVWQVSPDGQAGVRVKNQFDSMAGGGISAQAKNPAEGTGSSPVAAGEHGRLGNGMDGTIRSRAAAFDPTPGSASQPGSAGDKVQPLFASAPDSSAVNGTAVQPSGSLPTTPSGIAVPQEFAAPAGVLGTSLAPAAAPWGADASLNSATNPSRGPDAAQAGPLNSTLSEQADSSWSGFGSMERSADRAGEPSGAVIEGLQSAQPGLESRSDLLAPETKTGPGKQSTSASNPILSNGPGAPASKSTDPLASLAATKAGVAGIEPLALPTVPALAAVQSSSQSVVNGGAKALSDAGGAKNTTALNTTDGTSGNATTTGSGSGSGPVDGSSHSAESSGQPVQVASAAPPQISGTVANAVAHIETAVPVAPMDSSPAASTHRAQDGSDVPSGFAGQQAASGTVHEEGSEPVATSSINTARLMQSMGESEMRVGMRSTEFGDISIRTSVSQQQMVAQISLDHSDLSQAIAAHVSTVQAKLGEDYGIHASIEVHNLGSGLANDPGQSSPREQSDFRRSARPRIGLAGAEESSSVQFAAVASLSSGNRLDIRA
jgi:hypothetical protein